MSQGWTPPPPPQPQPGHETVDGTAPLVLAIVSLPVSLCGCWPSAALAIAAIVFATQVNSKVSAGDIQGARESAKKAKIFSLIAIGLSVLGVIIVIVYYVFILGVAATQDL